MRLGGFRRKSFSDLRCNRNLFHAVIAVIIGAAISAPSSRAQEPATPPIDFQSQIWPILQTHCIECHGPNKQKGELRLDRREFVDAGGHTGNTIVGDRPETSELFLRITSNDPKYRMPSNHPPLSSVQIETIRQWILSGGPWPNETEIAAKTVQDYPWLVRLEPFLVTIETAFAYIRPIVIPLVAMLIGVLLIERSKRRYRRNQIDASERDKTSRGTSSAGSRRKISLAGFRREWYLICGLLIALFVIWNYYRNETAAQRRTVSQLTKIIADEAAKDVVPVQRTAAGGPVPPRPKHVRQLGGLYYRGNDERDPRLYNGGFYRTANMRLQLSGPDKQPLHWGDSIGEGELFITLEIERAKQATPALFTDAIMNSIFLSQQVALLNRPEMADEPAWLEVVEPGNRWVANYPIRKDRTATKLSGMVYVYKGRVDNGQVDAKFHYGISYDVQIEGGRISPDSDLWMGSLSVPVNLLIPPPDRMVLNEWFDFRPLPEIEGENTTDPALLGIPEYVK